MYEWISSIDNTFQEREPFDTWSQKVKKKDLPQEQIPIQEEESEVISVQEPSESNTQVLDTPITSATSEPNDTSGLADTSQNEEANIEDKKLPEVVAVEEDENTLNKISKTIDNQVENEDSEFERYVNSIDG